LGWLVDPGDRSILTFQPQQQPELLRDDDPLTMLDGINLDLTAAQVFDWLTLKTKSL
jgi:Uma2 family endonuclease